MLKITRENILKQKNPYLDKLIEHYGDLNKYENVLVLYYVILGKDEELQFQGTIIVFMVQKGLKVEFVKIFGIGNNICSLKVDLVVNDLTNLEELKKIVKYGTNFKYWDLDDINLFDLT